MYDPVPRSPAEEFRKPTPAVVVLSPAEAELVERIISEVEEKP